jgi:hypothetical protein
MSVTQNVLRNTPEPLSSNQPPPSGRPAPVGRRMVETVAGIGVIAVWIVSGTLLELGFLGVVLPGVLLLAAFQILVRRRPLRTLLVRDTATFAHRWAGKLLVAAVLVAIPTTTVLLSLSGGRYGRYADESWKALLMLVVLAGSYLATRRLVLTVLIAAVTVAVVSWLLSPNLAAARNGDRTVLAHLDQQAGRGMLAGHHHVALAEVDLDAAQPVRLAGIGADDTTAMEVGSMTKAMTGLVIADAARRGGIRMNAPVARAVLSRDRRDRGLGRRMVRHPLHWTLSAAAVRLHGGCRPVGTSRAGLRVLAGHRPVPAIQSQVIRGGAF